MGKLRSFALASVAALFAGGAHAATVTAVGDAFSVGFNGIVDVADVPTVMPGLSATSEFTVTSWSYDAGADETEVSFDVLITNTSDASIWQSAVVTSIGFNTDPDAVAGSSSGVFDEFVIGGSFPTGAGFTVEYCASGNHNNCNGPGNTPLNVGQFGTASITLTLAGNVGELDLTDFGIRWQALASTQLGIADGSGIGTNTPPIPEPGAMALFGIGALAVGAAIRRRAIA
jgi:hypothetical protein